MYANELPLARQPPVSPSDLEGFVSQLGTEPEPQRQSELGIESLEQGAKSREPAESLDCGP